MNKGMIVNDKFEDDGLELSVNLTDPVNAYVQLVAPPDLWIVSDMTRANIYLDSPDYHHDGVNLNGVLNREGIIAFDAMMSRLSDAEGGSGLTNWQVCCILWNVSHLYDEKFAPINIGAGKPPYSFGLRKYLDQVNNKPFAEKIDLTDMTTAKYIYVGQKALKEGDLETFSELLLEIDADRMDLASLIMQMFHAAKC